MSKKVLLINAKRNGYDVYQCGETITAGELIALLADFDEDTPVYLKHDNGYTYGNITTDDFEESEDEEEEEDE